MAVSAAIHDWLSSCEPGKRCDASAVVKKQVYMLACLRAKRRLGNAEVRHREGNTRSRQSIRYRTKGDFSEIMSVLRGMGPEIQWLQSYVTGDNI